MAFYDCVRTLKLLNEDREAAEIIHMTMTMTMTLNIILFNINIYNEVCYQNWTT